MPRRLTGARRQIPGASVQRILPSARQRSLGPFCFLDAFGPFDLPPGARGVGPHPHIGLQTATWLFEGAVLHGDSIGSEQRIEPGQLNLMTSGRGIAHWEQMRPELAATLHGIQLWIALPDAHRRTAPAFEHVADPPTFTVGGWTTKVFLGSHAGRTCPARIFSPMVGAELRGSGPLELPLDPAWEHGLLLVDGEARVGEHALAAGEVLSFEPGIDALTLHGEAARVVLLGGPPFDEPLLLWWNFVARTHDEIVQARQAWETRTGFGDPSSWPREGQLDAPPLPPHPLKARG